MPQTERSGVESRLDDIFEMLRMINGNLERLVEKLYQVNEKLPD